MVQIRIPTSAETPMWGKWLATILAIYTSRNVAPEMNLRVRIYHVRLHQARIRLPTLDLKPRGDVIRSMTQGYMWPEGIFYAGVM